MKFLELKLIKKKSNFRKIFIKIPLVDRWLISQLLPPMLFAIGAFTAVSLSVGIMFDLVRKIVEFGLPLQTALKVLLLKLPDFLFCHFYVYAFATLLAYGKLSSNSELLALKSLGYTNKRIIVQVVILSFLMTCITFYFNIALPISNRVAEYYEKLFRNCF